MTRLYGELHDHYADFRMGLRDGVLAGQGRALEDGVRIPSTTSKEPLNKSPVFAIL